MMAEPQPSTSIPSSAHLATAASPSLSAASSAATSPQHTAEQRLFNGDQPNGPSTARPGHSTTSPNSAKSTADAADDEASIGDPQQDLQILLEPTERPLGRPNRGAFRHLKKPPQPHMCIRDTTAAGEELFINVMSWTRIMMPASAEHPIPLYGGMRVSVERLVGDLHGRFCFFNTNFLYFILIILIWDKTKCTR